MRRWMLVALAGLLLMGRLQADVIHLKDGTQLEGDVVEESPGTLVVKTRFGKVTVARDRIERIERREAPRDVLRRRREQVAEDDADGWFALAQFAAEHELRKEHRALLKQTLKADPEHAGAHQALGHVRHGGRWMTPAERDAAVEDEYAAAQRLQGLMLHEGEWVTTEAKLHLLAGRVDYDGEWVTPDEARRRQGYIEVGERWAPPGEAKVLKLVQRYNDGRPAPLVTATEGRVTAATSRGLTYATELAEAGRKALAWATPILGEPADLSWLGDRNLWVVVLDERPHFEGFTHFFSAHEPKTDSDWARVVARSEGFYWWDPVGTSAVCMGTRVEWQTTAHSIHNLGHVLLNRHGYNFRYLPAWLDEGFAVLAEHEVLQVNVTSCLYGGAKYARTGRGREEELLPGPAWLERMVARIQKGQDPPLATLIEHDLGELNAGEVVKSMAVLKYLTRERGAEFRRFLAAVREHWPAGTVNHRSPQARAAQQASFAALGMTPTEVDAAVRRHFGGK